MGKEGRARGEIIRLVSKRATKLLDYRASLHSSGTHLSVLFISNGSFVLFISDVSRKNRSYERLFDRRVSSNFLAL